MVGDQEQRPVARYILLTFDAGAARKPFERPGASRSEARLADYSVVGQDLARQTTGRYARDRLHDRAPVAYLAQAEGGDEVVHTYLRETFEVILAPRSNAELLGRARQLRDAIQNASSRPYLHLQCQVRRYP